MSSLLIIAFSKSTIYCQKVQPDIVSANKDANAPTTNLTDSAPNFDHSKQETNKINQFLHDNPIFFWMILVIYIIPWIYFFIFLLRDVFFIQKARKLIKLDVIPWWWWILAIFIPVFAWIITIKHQYKRSKFAKTSKRTNWDIEESPELREQKNPTSNPDEVNPAKIGKGNFVFETNTCIASHRKNNDSTPGLELNPKVVKGLKLGGISKPIPLKNPYTIYNDKVNKLASDSKKKLHLNYLDEQTGTHAMKMKESNIVVDIQPQNNNQQVDIEYTDRIMEDKNSSPIRSIEQEPRRLSQAKTMRDVESTMEQNEFNINMVNIDRSSENEIDAEIIEEIIISSPEPRNERLSLTNDLKDKNRKSLISQKQILRNEISAMNIDVRDKVNSEKEDSLNQSKKHRGKTSPSKWGLPIVRGNKNQIKELVKPITKEKINSGLNEKSVKNSEAGNKDDKVGINQQMKCENLNLNLNNKDKPLM